MEVCQRNKRLRRGFYLTLTTEDIRAACEGLGIQFINGLPFSGIPGITWYKPCNKWRVMVFFKGKVMPSKTFDILDLKDAIAYRQELEEERTKLIAEESENVESKLGFTIVSEEEKKTAWTKEDKPEKFESRQKLFTFVKSRLLRPIEFAFELPGLDFESTKSLVDLCVNKDYSRIVGCEDDNVIIRSMMQKNPGINLYHAPASRTMYSLALERKFVFDFIWGDFLGSYCDETERFLENIFRYQMIRTGGFLFITLGNAHGKDNWLACQRAMFEFNRISHLAKEQERNIFNIFPATVINMAASHLYVLDLCFTDQYQSGKSTMRVWGFEAHKYDTVIDAKLHADEELKKIYY